MRAAIYTFGLALALSLGARADVVILKSGERVSGRVVKKQQHYDVTTAEGLRTFTHDEVERILNDPKEILGDSDALYSMGKVQFQSALNLRGREQTALLKAAIGKITQAREKYSEARELFPEPKHAALDKKLVQVMQLLRMARSRLGSEIAHRPVNHRGLPTITMGEAFEVLRDPAKRTEDGKRKTAHESFRALRAQRPDLYDLATAAMIFLSKPEDAWKMAPASKAALQNYFESDHLKDPFSLTPEKHLAAAKHLSGQPASEPIELFASGHLGHVTGGVEAVARKLGHVVNENGFGPAEGHAVRDLVHWIENGDFDLAVLAFKTTHRKTDTPNVRFVWSYALLRLVQEKRRGWDRPVNVMKAIRTQDVAFREHLAALARSIEAVASCNTCLGEARLRCTNCHGKKEIRYDCLKCKGTGKKPVVATPEGFRRGFGDSNIPCYPCRGRGFTKRLLCKKCKDGTIDCKQCKEEAYPPEMDEIIEASAPCGWCDARGTIFRKALYPCPHCRGLGRKLTPAAGPGKTLR